MGHIAVLLRRILRTGRGRPAALLLLGIMAAVVALPDISPFKSGQLALFDAYQHWLPRERISGPVSIVSIDEHALARYGQWPWPRTRLAELINRIAALGAVAIGLDIIMPESDRTSPEALAASLSDRHKALQTALSLLPHNDTVLAGSLQRVPSVLGAAGFDVATPAVSQGLRAWPVVVRGGDALAYVHRYPYVLASLPLFQAAASGQALLSADLERGVVRRVPLIHAVGDTLVPTLALEMLRVATGAAAVEVAVDGHGISAVSVGDLRVPTASNSEAWVPYSSFAPERYVSAQDILEETANPEMIRNKLVMVALTGLGLMDYKTSARGEYVPGVEVHAQLIESFFDGRFLQRPWWMTRLEVALLLLGGFFLIWAMPKVKPRMATLLATILFVVLFGASLALFRWAGLLLDAVSVSSGINLVFGSLLGTAFIEADRGRRDAQRSLQVER